MAGKLEHDVRAAERKLRIARQSRKVRQVLQSLSYDANHIIDDSITDVAGNAALSETFSSIVNHSGIQLVGYDADGRIAYKTDSQYVSLTANSSVVYVPEGEEMRVYDVAGAQTFRVFEGGTLELTGASGNNLIILEGYSASQRDSLAVSINGTTVSFWHNGEEVATIGVNARATDQIIKLDDASYVLHYGETVNGDVQITFGGRDINPLGTDLALMNLAPVI